MSIRRSTGHQGMSVGGHRFRLRVKEERVRPAKTQAGDAEIGRDR